MHSILVTFHSEIPADQLAEGMSSQMPLLRSTEGLVMKTFIATDAHNLGGFYIFTSPGAAASFLEGEFFAGLKAIPGVSNIQVKHFQVAEPPSLAMGTPGEPLVRAAAAL